VTTLPLAPPSHWLLGGDPAQLALVEDDRSVSYGELARLVEERRIELGPVRRLVAMEAAPTIGFVTAYLAALAGEHPVLLLAPGHLDRHHQLREEYRPDVVVDADGLLEIVSRESTHHLHPDLALLLSTSGSTGSPKLVRLSRRNVLANARSIGEYLDLRATDTGITTLPLHYCYGLSVLHSHLLAGATVVLTDLSVADECFWELAGRTSVTGLAGVPHTYDLLDAVQFGSSRLPGLPSLRYLTQAGGRMEPARVREYAGLAAERGVDLFVMYGQTEATARMAFLPPELAATHPETIGVAIPGGRLRIDPVPGVEEPGVGELVYAGPNVMMGYAESSRDLAEGPLLSELRTGDLARSTPVGLFQVVGRLDRQAKVLGHRLDLDRVEAMLTDSGLPARVVARPSCLWVFVTTPRPRDRDRVLAAVKAATGLAGAAARVASVDALPLLASGKPDDGALRQHVARLEEVRSPVRQSGPMTAQEIRDLYAVVLGRPDATIADSFAGLGGDSLSYVEVSVRLAERLGPLPSSWPSISAASLSAISPGRADARPLRETWRSLRTVPLDITVVLRAVAITLVVVTHADLVQLQGGAHVLLAVVGFNLVRFQLAVPDRRGRVLALVRSAGAVAVPAMCFVGALVLLGRTYRWPTALLLNGALGGDGWDEQWHFWFLEAVVWSYLGLAALLVVPLLDRLVHRRPFAAWVSVLGVTLSTRYAWTGIEAGTTERYTPGVVLWCVALGACAAQAATVRQRVLVAVLAVVATAGFFDDPRRELIVVAGVLLLLLRRPVRLPRSVAAVLSVVASASLWIYLSHWQVYPGLEAAGRPVLAVAASLVVGIACQQALCRLSRQVRGVLRPGLRRPQRTPAPRRRSCASATSPASRPGRAPGWRRTPARRAGPGRSATTARTCP
jgi:hypothetical protein